MTKNKLKKLLLTFTILSLFHCAISARNPLDSSQPLGAIYQLLPIFFPSLKPSSAKEMKTYFIPSTGSSAVITGTKMSLIVPYSTDLSSLSAEFYHTGKSATVNGIEQITGQTLNSYSQALVYTITAANATQKNYTLSTAKGNPDSNTLFGFQFDSTNTKGLISGTSVLLNVPYGTDVKNLIPTFSHNGSKVFLNNTEQVSGKTANDFSSPLLYEVQAENGSRKQYTTVVVSGTLTSNTIQGISVDGIEGAITGDSIYFNFPTSKNVSSVSPIISHLGSTITVNGQPFVNGETTLDLTLPQRVKVTSADGTVKEYTIYSGYSIGTGTGTTTGTGTGTTTGSGTATVTGVAPSSLTYTGSPFTFIQNTAITTQIPTVTGAVTNCIASPALPTGLNLDATTCAISGTPTVTQATNNYAIVASNASGNTAAIISIIVNDAPPSSLTFTGGTYNLYRNVQITPITPNIIGVVTSCSASPTLPTGLTINNTTCAISGTPPVIQTDINYTITASNISGNTTATISIAVVPSWIQEAYLKAANAETTDQFGYSVSVSSDTIAVGVYLEDSNQTTIMNGTTASMDNSVSDSGAVYVFKRTGTMWAQEAYLKAPNAEANDRFGISVSVSSDTIAVGASGEDNNQTTITNGATVSDNNLQLSSGAVYVFKRTGTTWAQEAYLKAPNAWSGDQFGSSVSASSDTIVVGAEEEDSNQTTITNGTTVSDNNSATSSGAVYVFKRNGTTWVHEAYLKASNAEANDNFSRSVSISSDTIAVGASSEDSNQTTITNGTSASTDNSASGIGAVYVFKRTGTAWAQEAYLKAPNGRTNIFFGESVSISLDTIVVGASSEDGNQTTITNGTTASMDTSRQQSGAVYVFRRTGANWAQEAYIKPSNAGPGDLLGTAVSISGDTIVAGTYRDGSNQTTISHGTIASLDNSLGSAGAAYVFKRTGTIWAQEAYLKAPNVNLNDQFAYSLSVSGDTIAVGANQEDSNQTTITNGTTASADNSAAEAGAVYVFRRK